MQPEIILPGINDFMSKLRDKAFLVCTNPECPAGVARTTRHTLLDEERYQCEACGRIRSKRYSKRQKPVDPNSPME
jgi:hypothetical protein